MEHVSLSFLFRDGGRWCEYMATYGTLLTGCPAGNYALPVFLMLIKCCKITEVSAIVGGSLVQAQPALSSQDGDVCANT